MTRLHDALHRAGVRIPEKPAVIYQDRRISFQELWSSACRWAEWLRDRFPRRTRIGILLPNVPQAVWGLYGTSAADMIAVPLDSDLHPRNLEYILSQCRVPLILTSRTHLPRLENLRNQRQLQVVIADQDADSDTFVAEGTGVPNGEAQDNPDSASQAYPDTACILYTTGTTGPRKGVVLTHANLQAATENITRVMRIEGDIVESLPMRLSHSFGFARLRTVLGAGGTVILENGFLRPEWILHRIKRYRANALSAAPSGFSIFMDRFQDEFERVGPLIRYIEIGSDFMPQEQKLQLMRICPDARIFMHYGLTEASRTCFLDFHLDQAHLHTSGKPAPGVHVRIGGPSGTGAEEKTCGEILVKGPIVTPGYWEQPELTHQTLKDGWLHTGDQGFIDAHGYLHLQGRRQDTINLGGMKVAPQEVEDVLRSFPGVRDAAVVKMEAKEANEIPGLKALLVKEERKAFTGIESLRRYCQNQLETYKIPREFKIVAQLPKSDSGKIQRWKLTNE
jgi:long-chain acyl-CoA synthetase